MPILRTSKYEKYETITFMSVGNPIMPYQSITQDDSINLHRLINCKTKLYDEGRFNGDGTPANIQSILLLTMNQDDLDILKYFLSGESSVHYIILTDGTVVSIVPDTHRAWAAGESARQNQQDKRAGEGAYPYSINSSTLSIAFAKADQSINDEQAKSAQRLISILRDKYNLMDPFSVLLQGETTLDAKTGNLNRIPGFKIDCTKLMTDTQPMSHLTENDITKALEPIFTQKKSQLFNIIVNMKQSVENAQNLHDLSTLHNHLSSIYPIIDNPESDRVKIEPLYKSLISLGYFIPNIGHIHSAIDAFSTRYYKELECLQKLGPKQSKISQVKFIADLLVAKYHQ